MVVASDVRREEELDVDLDLAPCRELEHGVIGSCVPGVSLLMGITGLAVAVAVVVAMVMGLVVRGVGKSLVVPAAVAVAVAAVVVFGSRR